MFNRLQVGPKARARRPGVLALLAVLWLNMAILPCAMAFPGDEDCPHCPPAEQHEMHHGMAASQGHDHGQVEVKPSCSTTQAECCDVVTGSVDARGGKLDYKPTSDIACATAPFPGRSSCRLAAVRQSAVDPPDIVGSSPPIHILYCVYLK
jgi:hypothetical protein